MVHANFVITKWTDHIAKGQEAGKEWDPVDGGIQDKLEINECWPETRIIETLLCQK